MEQKRPLGTFVQLPALPPCTAPCSEQASGVQL
jgi:hypothetical protein